MITIWVLSVTVNLLLIMAIVRRKAWRKLPLFSAIQFLELAMILIQIYLYFSPRISQEQYHNFWLFFDQATMVFDSLCFHDLLKRCPEEKWLCVGGYLYLLHFCLKLHEYVLRQHLPLHHSIYTARIWLNLILTLLLAIVIYYWPEVNKMSDPKQPNDEPVPEDDGGNDGGAPEQKPGH